MCFVGYLPSLIIHQIFSLARDWSKRVTWLNIPKLKLGMFEWISPIFKTALVSKNIWRIINTTASIWRENKLGYLSLDIISAPNGGYSLYISSLARAIEVWRGVTSRHLTNRMCSVVCALIDNDMRHCSGQNVVDSQGAAEWVHEIVFYHNIRAWPRAWHIDASSVVWTLIDNGKLANQIARLVAIVVKKIKCVYMTCLYPFQIGGKTEFYYKKKKWG